jgi:hypothetical protein
LTRTVAERENPFVILAMNILIRKIFPREFGSPDEQSNIRGLFVRLAVVVMPAVMLLMRAMASGARQNEKVAQTARLSSFQTIGGTINATRPW